MKLVRSILLAATLATAPTLVLNASNHAQQESSTKVDEVNLISAEEAKKLIGKDGVVFITGDNESVYELGHIKGSIEMYAHDLHISDNGKMNCPPLFMCPEEAEEYISKKGVKNSDLIIAYDDFRGPNATGVYAFFKSFGHDNIRLLDGGRSAMMEADPNQARYDGLTEQIKTLKKDKAPKAEIEKVEKEQKALEPKLLVQKGKGTKLKPSNYKVDEDKINYNWIAGKDELIVAMEDIREKGKDSEYVIIDSRGMNEITGERYLDNVARAGHIPGSTFVEWSQITDFDNRLSFEELEEMRKTFEKYGITKDKTVYSYCHVGAGRSSHIISALKLLGYENVKIYTGSWDEWGNDMDLPIQR
ncbi:MAG: sulfurtransferase [Campylobacterales bacterium]